MHILVIEAGGTGDSLPLPEPGEAGSGDLRVSVARGVAAAREALADEHDLVLLDAGSQGQVDPETVAALRPLLGGRPLVLRASGAALRRVAGAASLADAVLPAQGVAAGDLALLLEGILQRHRRARPSQARVAELEERVRTAESARVDLQAIVDATPGLFLVLTPDDFRIVAASDAYLEATHLRRDQALGRRLFDLFPDDPLEPDADGVRNLRLSLRRVAETGQADAMAVQRYPIRRVGGSGGEFEERFWSPANAPVFGPDGVLRFVVHRVEDVTEYVRARRAAGEDTGEGGEGFDRMEADLFLRAREIQELNHRLARSEERVRRVFEVAAVGFAVTDLHGRFLYTNPAFSRMVGRTPGELHSLDFRSIIHPGDLQESEEVVRRIREGARGHEVLEKRYVRPDGEPVWARSSVSTVGDRRGSPRQMVVVSEDITAERIVLQRLMENERLLTMAGRMAQLGGWTVDLASGSLHWSDQVCAIHGVPPGTRVTAEEGLAFYAPEWRPVIHEAFERCIAEGAPFDLDLEIVTTAGERNWVRVVGEAVRDGDGNVVRVQGAFQDISERKRAEEEIQASERRFREFAESMPLVVWSADREGRVDYITGAMSRYAGVDPAGLVGESWISLVHPGDVARCAEAWGRSTSTGEPYALEFRLRREDGAYRWHLVRAIPVRDDEGRVVRWYGSATDIEDLREATLKLRESEERFRSVARVTSDVLWDWDLTTDALWWGDGFQETFGFYGGEAETDISSWTSRIHPADLERVEEGLRRAWESEEAEWRDEYRFRRADGSYARVRDRGRIVRDGTGRAIRMLGGISDETESLEAEARLREQAELLDLARDAIIVRELDLTIASWNPGAERIYGWSRDEVLGRRSEDFLETDPATCTEALDACLRHGEWSRELEQRRKDGSTVEIEALWTLVHDAAGEPHRILSIHSDITERRKLMAQFLRAQRLESIGTLAGGIAHDLNNVLSPILMAIALLKLELPEDEGVQEVLSTIEGSARRGAEMVKQVLGFARGVEGQRLHVDLGRILDDLGRVVRDTFPRGITFRKEVPPDLWSPWGDPTQIHQVLMNLLVNARDAMPGGGTLAVLAENVRLDESYAAMSPEANPGRYVRVSVRDSGTGMPAEVLDRIFDPFFTTKGVGQGTGLGLSTVQAILRSHGGFVNVYSEPGKGTTFRIHFPTEGEEGIGTGDVEQGLAEGEAPRGNGELVLVVDDEAAVRDITRQALEASGYRVVTASDGAEAVALCGRMTGEVAVVLTDLMMPIMDGPSTVRALRHIDPSLRIIASSGLAVGEGVEQVTEAGVRYFLPKPYTAGSLLHAIHRALRDD